MEERKCEVEETGERKEGNGDSWNNRRGGGGSTGRQENGKRNEELLERAGERKENDAGQLEQQTRMCVCVVVGRIGGYLMKEKVYWS